MAFEDTRKGAREVLYKVKAHLAQNIKAALGAHSGKCFRQHEIPLIIASKSYKGRAQTRESGSIAEPKVSKLLLSNLSTKCPEAS